MPDWRMKAVFGANGTQTSFVNWNAGGRNNVSMLGFINAKAYYSKNDIRWDNDLALALGGLQYVGKGAGEETLQKTDDRLELSTKIGHRLKDDLYYSLIGSFRTQFLDGYKYPNDSVRVSRFMAPGYLNFGFGIDYAPSDDMTVFISPVAGKLTFVRDQKLADAGSFGVDPAVYDATTGNVVTHGKMLRTEFGAYVKVRYHKEIFTNIDMITSLDLFSNYLDRPQNIDVNADVLFTFKVNSWFSASLNWTLLYDHDIKILDASGGYGPRTQFKSVIGLGISYSVKNFEEKK